MNARCLKDVGHNRAIDDTGLRLPERRNDSVVDWPRTEGSPFQSSLSLWLDAPERLARWAAPEWLARWGVVAALYIIDAVWLAARNDTGSALAHVKAIALPAVLITAASVLAAASFDKQRFARPLFVAFDFTDLIVYVFVFLSILSPFTSLMASLCLPLVDEALKRADELLGFEWSVASNWVTQHSLVDLVFSKAYFSLLWQAPFILLIGSYTRPGERNAEGIWLFVIGVLICLTLAAALPALGYPGVIGMKHIEELQRIREGHFTVMSPGSGGLVTFPSFHAELAVIYIYCVRHYRWALAFFGPLTLS